MGIACGIILTGVGWIWHQAFLGMVVGVSLVIAFLVSTSMATFMPIFLKRMGVDPAVAPVRGEDEPASARQLWGIERGELAVAGKNQDLRRGLRGEREFQCIVGLVHRSAIGSRLSSVEGPASAQADR